MSSIVFEHLKIENVNEVVSNWLQTVATKFETEGVASGDESNALVRSKLAGFKAAHDVVAILKWVVESPEQLSLDSLKIVAEIVDEYSKKGRSALVALAEATSDRAKAKAQRDFERSLDDLVVDLNEEVDTIDVSASLLHRFGFVNPDSRMMSTKSVSPLKNCDRKPRKLDFRKSRKSANARNESNRRGRWRKRRPPSSSLPSRRLIAASPAGPMPTSRPRLLARSASASSPNPRASPTARTRRASTSLKTKFRLVLIGSVRRRLRQFESEPKLSKPVGLTRASKSPSEPRSTRSVGTTQIGRLEPSRRMVIMWSTMATSRSPSRSSDIARNR
jgi:hypothetical protein